MYLQDDDDAEPERMTDAQKRKLWEMEGYIVDETARGPFKRARRDCPYLGPRARATGLFCQLVLSTCFSTVFASCFLNFGWSVLGAIDADFIDEGFIRSLSQKIHTIEFLSVADLRL